MASVNSLDVLIQALRRLPGVGAKTAARMAFHLLQHDRAGARQLAQALQDAAEHVHHCERCHTFTEAEVCSTCLDSQRDASKLCVVETPADQSVMERTGAFKGLYFVLMGRLSQSRWACPGTHLCPLSSHPALKGVASGMSC